MLDHAVENILSKDDGAAPPAKRLAIMEEREEDKYTHSTELKCWLCDAQSGTKIPGALDTGKVTRSLRLKAEAD